MNAKAFLYCSLILFSSVVFSGETNQAQDFNMLDASGNGYITVNEAQGNIELLRSWGDVDKNTDGFVDFIEFSAFEVPQSIEISATFQPIVDEDNPDLGAAPTE